MRLSTFFKYFLLILGIIFLSLSFLIYKDSSNALENYAKTTGTVEDYVISYSNNSSSKNTSTKTKMYSPIFSFVDKSGQQHSYKASYSSSSPSYEIGEKLEILYDPASPSNAMANDFMSLWLGAVITAGIGGVTTLIALILFLTLRTKNLDKYKRHGKEIIATIVEIKKNTTLKVNGVQPFKIHADWLDKINNKTYRFVSDNIWFDPTNQLTDGQIKVYILDNKPSNYIMDISHLNSRR